MWFMMAEQSLAISHNILPKLQKNGEISKCFRKKHGEFSFFFVIISLFHLGAGVYSCSLNGIKMPLSDTNVCSRCSLDKDEPVAPQSQPVTPTIL